MNELANGSIATARRDHWHQPCSWNESHTIEAHQGLRSDPDSILSLGDCDRRAVEKFHPELSIQSAHIDKMREVGSTADAGFTVNKNKRNRLRTA